MIGLNTFSRLAVFVVLILSVSMLCVKSPVPSNGTVLAQAPTCENGIGGRIFSNGGNVEVEILPSIAGFTSELSFVSPAPTRFIGTNRDVGTIVNLGSFPAGTELVFSIFVRETSRTFYSGPASSNPDGLGHGDVTCLSNKARIGFEDQFGGGDRNYGDLICEVRLPLSNCAYSMSPSSQSFDAGGGSGSVQVVVNSGCNWSASSNAGWISIESGGSGSASGTVRYSVAPNQNADSRSGTISLQSGAFTVYQDGLGSGPLIMSTTREGKRVYLYGINFDSGSVILLNGDKQKTLHDESNPRTVIIGKKLAKWAIPGDRIQVRTSTGALSPAYIYEP
jgi:hypothetical protein